MPVGNLVMSCDCIVLLAFVFIVNPKCHLTVYFSCSSVYYVCQQLLGILAVLVHLHGVVYCRFLLAIKLLGSMITCLYDLLTI